MCWNRFNKIPTSYGDGYDNKAAIRHVFLLRRESLQEALHRRAEKYTDNYA